MFAALGVIEKFLEPLIGGWCFIIPFWRKLLPDPPTRLLVVLGERSYALYLFTVLSPYGDGEKSWVAVAYSLTWIDYWCSWWLGILWSSISFSNLGDNLSSKPSCSSVTSKVDNEIPLLPDRTRSLRALALFFGSSSSQLKDISL